MDQPEKSQALKMKLGSFQPAHWLESGQSMQTPRHQLNYLMARALSPIGKHQAIANCHTVSLSNALSFTYKELIMY